MLIKILTVGKVKNKSLLFEIEDLKRRVSRLDVVELKEIKDSNINVVKRKEFELIDKYLSSSSYNVLLSEFGKEFETKEFYDYFRKIEKPILFVITGPFGANEELKKKVDFVLSLSKMTFTHEQALYMLVEQIYRMQCFERNVDYTK